MLTIKEFLTEHKLKLEPNTSIDIRNLGKKIRSFNHETLQLEWKPILKVIRKPDDKTYLVKTISSELECTLDHKFSTDISGEYKTVEEIINEGFHKISIVTKKGYENIIEIIPTNKYKEIYDLEVEGNHNLYTNGLLSHNSMGDPTTVSGGTAIPFYAHCRIRITRSSINRDDRCNTMKFTIIKNKMSEPFKVGTIIYKWGKGFDFASEVGQLAQEFGIISLNGRTYSLPEIDADTKIVGKKQLGDFLENNPEYVTTVLQPKVEEILKNQIVVREDEQEQELF